MKYTVLILFCSKDAIFGATFNSAFEILCQFLLNLNIVMSLDYIIAFCGNYLWPHQCTAVKDDILNSTSFCNYAKPEKFIYFCMQN